VSIFYLFLGLIRVSSSTITACRYGSWRCGFIKRKKRTGGKRRRLSDDPPAAFIKDSKLAVEKGMSGLKVPFNVPEIKPLALFVPDSS